MLATLEAVFIADDIVYHISFGDGVYMSNAAFGTVDITSGCPYYPIYSVSAETKKMYEPYLDYPVCIEYGEDKFDTVSAKEYIEKHIKITATPIESLGNGITCFAVSSDGIKSIVNHKLSEACEAIAQDGNLQDNMNRFLAGQKHTDDIGVAIIRIERR